MLSRTSRGDKVEVLSEGYQIDGGEVEELPIASSMSKCVKGFAESRMVGRAVDEQ